MNDMKEISGNSECDDLASSIVRPILSQSLSLCEECFSPGVVLLEEEE